MQRIRYERKPCIKQRREANVRHAVPVGDHEGLAIKKRLEPLDPTPGIGLDAGVDQVNSPILGRGDSRVDLTGGEIDAKIAVEGQNATAVAKEYLISKGFLK